MFLGVIILSITVELRLGNDVQMRLKRDSF